MIKTIVTYSLFTNFVFCYILIYEIFKNRSLTKNKNTFHINSFSIVQFIFVM